MIPHDEEEEPLSLVEVEPAGEVVEDPLEIVLNEIAQLVIRQSLKHRDTWLQHSTGTWAAKMLTSCTKLVAAVVMGNREGAYDALMEVGSIALNMLRRFYV